MSEFWSDRQIRGVALFCLGYAVLTLPPYLATRSHSIAFMPWNLVLACLPLFVTKIMEELRRPAPVKLGLLGLLWLLLFPNAPYLLTDFIHISGYQYTEAMADGTNIYAGDFLSWLRLAHIGLGAAAGTLAGLLSLYRVHMLLKKRFGRAPALCAVGASGLLSGYGVYLGRFLRLNSWDILKPVTLFRQIKGGAGLFPLQFTLLFTLYILLSYLFFYIVFHCGRQNE